MKKTIKKKKAVTRDITAILLEDLKSQFTVFGEGLSFVSDKMDKLEIGQQALSAHTEFNQ